MITVELAPFAQDGASFLAPSAPSPGGRMLAAWMGTDLRARRELDRVMALAAAAEADPRAGGWIWGGNAHSLFVAGAACGLRSDIDPGDGVVLSAAQLRAALRDLGAALSGEGGRARYRRGLTVSFEAEGPEAARRIEAMSHAHAQAQALAAAPRRGPGRHRRA